MDSCSFERIRCGIIRHCKKLLREEKEEINQEIIQLLQEDALTKVVGNKIVYLEVDGMNIHLQQEEKTKPGLKN